MDVTKVLADLREQRQTIEETILALERLGAAQGRRRGRPPAWMVEARKRAQPEMAAKIAPAPPVVEVPVETPVKARKPKKAQAA